ncbi:MAG: hypothetical protein MJ181_10845 [Treponema sp.]|nr:hypothetical protein [Treponema sp.]
MAIAEFYESLSDAKKVHVLQNGKTIAENFPSVTDWKSYKIIVNKCWNEPSHVVCPKDSIIIRKVPLGLDPLSWVLIGIGAVGLGFGIWGGVEGYKARKEAEKTKRELERLKNNSKDEVINLPYLKGASNSVATGKTQPYMIGQNLFTPYILNAGRNFRGYSTISGQDGKDQFYNVVLECGFNKQNLKKIYCDDIVLKKFNTDECQEGIFSLDPSVFASEDSFIEIAQDGNPFETSGFNQKIIEKQYSDNLKQHDSEHPEDYKDLFYTLESNSMGADVCILFNGLRKYTDDGTAGIKKRTIIPSYSVDYAHLVAIGDSDPLNNATWIDFFFDQNGTSSNEFERNTLQQIRFNAHVDFSHAEIFNNGVRRYSEPITIRVSTPDVKPEKGSEYSETYVEWIHSYCYDAKKSSSVFTPEKIIGEREARLSTILGLRIKSTTDNQDKLKSIQIVSSGVARVYGSDMARTKSWSETKTPTSNPASWCLEVLTSDCHVPSKVDFNEDEFDLPSFGAWYDYCEREGHKLTVNFVITSGMTKSALLDLICECGHGYLYQNIFGQIAVAIDCEKENAIAVLNEQNMVSFSYTKEVKRKPDGLKLTYIDSESDYQENTVMIMYDGSDPEERSSDSIISSVNVQGKTNHEEVCRYGYYLMKKERLRPKVAKATIGNEGIFFTPLSKVLVQHPSLKIGKGNGEIKSVIYSEDDSQIVGLQLYDSVNLSESQNYSMIVQCVGSFGSEDYCTPLQIEIVGGKGITDEVEFVTPIPRTARTIPHGCDVFSYGLGTENVVDEMLISAIESNGDGFTLSLVDYDERIVDDSETIPEYIPDYTLPSKNVAEVPERPIVSFDDLYGVKKEVEDSTDRKIAAATFDASPTYNAEFNTSIIKKDNTGSYTPSFISANGYENKGLTEQNPFSGKWFVYINGSETAFSTTTGSSFRLNVQDILDSGIENIDTIEILFKTNDEKLTVRRELIQVLTGASAYSVKLSTPSIILETVENKRVSEITVKTKAEVYYGLKELTYQASDGWEYGIIQSPEGMEVSVNAQTGEISLKILEGSSLADMGSLKIPVFIHSQTSKQTVIGFESGNRIIVTGFNGVTIGFYEADENGYYNTYFTWQKLSQNTIRLASLTQTVNNYWTELTNDLNVTVAEKNTLVRLKDSITSDYLKYKERYNKYNYFTAYENKYNDLIGMIDLVVASVQVPTFDSKTSKDAFNQYFEIYYSAKADLDSEISSIAENFTDIDSVSKVSALKPKVNDFFVWLGGKNVVYGSSIFTTGMTYCWNGEKWVEDHDNTHIVSTMDEAIRRFEESEDETIPAVSFAKRLVAMEVVAKSIFANYVKVVDIMTQGATTIDGGKITTNSIKADSIDVDSLMSKELVLQNGGILRSEIFKGDISYTADFQTTGTKTVGSYFKKGEDWFVIISETKCVKAYSEPKIIFSFGYPTPSGLLVSGEDFITYQGTTTDVPVGSCYRYSGRYSEPSYYINLGKNNWLLTNNFNLVTGSYEISNISDMNPKNLTSGIFISSDGKIASGGDSNIGGRVSAFGFENKIDSGDYELFHLGLKTMNSASGGKYISSRKFFCSGKTKTSVNWKSFHNDEFREYSYVTKIELIRVREDVETVVYSKTFTVPEDHSPIEGSEDFILDIQFNDEIKLNYTQVSYSPGRPVKDIIAIPLISFSTSTRNELLMVLNDMREEIVK